MWIILRDGVGSDCRVDVVEQDRRVYDNVYPLDMQFETEQAAWDWLDANMPDARPATLQC